MVFPDITAFRVLIAVLLAWYSCRTVKNAVPGIGFLRRTSNPVASIDMVVNDSTSPNDTGVSERAADGGSSGAGVPAGRYYLPEQKDASAGDGRDLENEDSTSESVNTAEDVSTDTEETANRISSSADEPDAAKGGSTDVIGRPVTTYDARKLKDTGSVATIADRLRGRRLLSMLRDLVDALSSVDVPRLVSALSHFWTERLWKGPFTVWLVLFSFVAGIVVDCCVRHCCTAMWRILHGAVQVEEALQVVEAVDVDVPVEVEELLPPQAPLPDPILLRRRG